MLWGTLNLVRYFKLDLVPWELTGKYLRQSKYQAVALGKFPRVTLMLLVSIASIFNQSGRKETVQIQVGTSFSCQYENRRVSKLAEEDSPKTTKAWSLVTKAPRFSPWDATSDQWLC